LVINHDTEEGKMKEPTVEEMLVRLEKIVGLAKQQVCKDVYSEEIKAVLLTDFQIWCDRIRALIDQPPAKTVTRENLRDLAVVISCDAKLGEMHVLYLLEDFMGHNGIVVEEKK